MDRSLAMSHIRQLEIIANHWENEPSTGAGDVQYMARRAARQIRRIMEIFDAVDVKGREDSGANAEGVRREEGKVSVLRVGEQGDDQGGAPSDVEVQQAG